MLLTRVICNGYRPMFLNDIQELDLNIEAFLTLILGTNGCGKSSLLRLATAHPADRHDFVQGGFLKIYFEHRGSKYVAESNFSNGAKYSFTKDGEELTGNKNGGYGTATVQRAVVTEELGYTETVHKLLLGSLKFTKMNSTQRREILGQINPDDVDFALKLWGDIKVSNRDSTGVVKHLTAKTSDLQAERDSLVVDENLLASRHSLEEQLQELISFVSSAPPNVLSKEKELDSKVAQLDRLTKRVITYNQIPTSLADSNADALERISFIKGLMSSEENEERNVSRKILELGAVQESMLYGDLTLEDLELERKKLTSERELLVYDDFTGQPTTEAVYVEVEQLVQDLAFSVERTYTREEVSRATAGLLSINNNLRNINERIEVVSAKAIHFRAEINSVTCPKCSHTYNLSGGNPARSLECAELELKELGPRLADYLSTKEELVLLNGKTQGYVSRASDIQELRNRYSSLINYWSEAPCTDDILGDDSAWSTFNTKWRRNLLKKVTADKLTVDIDSLSVSINHAVKDGGATKVMKGELGDRLVEITNSRVSNLQELKVLREATAAFSKYTELHNECLRAHDETMVLLIELNEEVLQEAAWERRTVIYNKLAGLRTFIQKQESLDSALTSVKRDLTDSTIKREITSLLIEHLSPTHGVIADQMMGFINSFVLELNTILERIFEYDFTIEPCNMDNGKLDYKFPMRVAGEDISDISMSSSGQEDVINLAFAMVVRQYLDLNDFPLYLDETGASFDEVHTTNLMDYIKGLGDNSLCSQIFMINHYTSVHGGLSNNDVLVLDDRNITVPESYNENATIKFRSS